MSFSNQTQHYGLPQYIGSDVPSYLGDFNGAMMATPLYLGREIERVEHSNMSTGELYYGKLTDRTFFVEKEFYEYLRGIPQGLIMFRIPKECYEDVLQRMASLPSLSTELFEVKPLMEK